MNAVRALSQYRPFERGGASAREAQEDLLAACIAESGGSVPSRAALRDAVETLFRIELHQAEVDRGLGQLIKDNRVSRDGGQKYALTTTERQRLDTVATESQAIEQAALAEWKTYVISTWPGLTDVQVTQLEGELREYLVRVFRRHGAEAASVLYSDEAQSDELYSELENEGLSFLGAADPEVEAIREAAFSQFLRNPTETQKRFLGQDLNTCYFATLLSIDPEVASLVRDLAEGQRVYLDTNFIYRVLGVQGPRFVRASRTILETTKQVGYTCCVTPWTVEEFKRSLDRSRRYLHRYPIPPSEYSALLADATSDEDFVTAYWRQAKDAPVRIDDFFAHWREVEVHLGGLGIEVRTEGCKAIEAQADAIADEVAILGSALHGGYRHPELLAHDAQHRLLIRRLRGHGQRSFANGGYWFLTFDSVLPRYDHYAHAGERDGLSFCVTAGLWFQIIEAFRPKTDDVLQTLADLLASPYVRYRRTLSKDAAQAIVARVQLHRGADPELAARIMMNSLLIREIEDSEPDSKERTERIDNAIVAAAQRMQEDARNAQAEAELARQTAKDVEEMASRRLRELESQKAIEVAAAEARGTDAVAAEKVRREAEAQERERRHQEELALLQSEKAIEAQGAARIRRRLRAVVMLVVLAVLAMVGVLAVGLNAFWGAVGVIAIVVGIAAALDQLWIRR